MEKKIFVNFSHCPSEKWSSEQLEAAKHFDGDEMEIVDFSFPAVPSDYETLEVHSLAANCADSIRDMNPAVVLCQGEFTLTYNVVDRLKNKHIKVVSACSEVVETTTPDGNTAEKKTISIFTQFREY